MLKKKYFTKQSLSFNPKNEYARIKKAKISESRSQVVTEFFSET